MKILVTGRDGQVAQSLAERRGAAELVFAQRPDFDLADSRSIERVVAAVHPDLVISAAAYTAVDKAEDEPALAMRVNGEGPGVLARAAAAIGAPIVHLSTDYVFDGTGERAWREDDAVAPLGVYGKTKLAGEQAVAAAGGTYAIIRTAWVYSPFGHNFVRTMLRLATERDRLQVVDDQVGCPTSAFDIADALSALVNCWRENGVRGARETYHFAGPDEQSWADFARSIFSQSAALSGPTAQVDGISFDSYPTKARRPANSRLNSSKFAGAFGYCAPSSAQSLNAVVSRILVESPGPTG